jgi:hypothetical protein
MGYDLRMKKKSVLARVVNKELQRTVNCHAVNGAVLQLLHKGVRWFAGVRAFFGKLHSA